MNISIYQGNDLTVPKADINVIIDVIRAFTVAHYAFIHGVNEIWLAKATEEAFRLKRSQPDLLLAGEVNGVGVPGFDLDNSPASITTNVQGRTLVQKTTNGVKATLNSLHADHVFVTGFSNARTTATYINQLIGNKQKENISMNIIASHPTGDDDLACAEYIRGIILEDQALPPETVINRIEQAHVAQKFFDQKNNLFNKLDIDYCTKEVHTPFVMGVKQQKNIPKIVRIDL